MKQEFGHISETQSTDCDLAKAELAGFGKGTINRVVAQKEKREGWSEVSRNLYIRLQLKMEDKGYT